MGFSEFFCNMAQNLRLLAKCKGLQVLALGEGELAGGGRECNHLHCAARRARAIVPGNRVVLGPSGV